VDNMGKPTATMVEGKLKEFVEQYGGGGVRKGSSCSMAMDPTVSLGKNNAKSS
jgi:hypothetical protein